MATTAGGAWVVLRYILDRHDKSVQEKPSDPHKPMQGRTVSTGTGVAAGSDMQIGGNVSIQHNRIPKAAIALVAFGLLVLGYAVFNSGSHIDVRNGNYVGGNATNSQLNNK